MKVSKEEIKKLRKGYGGGKKLPTEFVREVIRRMGGVLDENFVYRGSTSKFEVKCDKGHLWSTCWGYIQSGNWCPKCGIELVKNSFRLDENIVREHVTSKKGMLDNDFKYINAFERFWVTCEKGHRFKTYWAILQSQDSWCPKCGRERVGAVLRQDKEFIRKYIVVKGGSLDENFEYKGAFEKFFVTCKEGHRFETFWNNLQSRDNWCPECSGSIVHVEDVLKLIEDKGGTVDTGFSYINSRVKFWITCSEGHKWETNWDNVKQGCWCPRCSGKIVYEDDVVKAVKNKGGNLDPGWKYINGSTKFWITCKNGHRFETQWGYIQPGYWCPYCLWKTQDEFRVIIERFFGKSFPSAWPEWLKYVHGKCLQLDGYNEELLTAFEYQGYQHYKPSHFYKYDEDRFNDLLKRDNFKKNVCINRGINLIVVPCFVSKKDWVALIESSIKGRDVV
jgi:rubredoxin